MNEDRKIIIITKGMDGSDGTSRASVTTPYKRANTIQIFAHQRDFVDDIIDALLCSKNVYELKIKLEKIINE